MSDAQAIYLSIESTLSSVAISERRRGSRNTRSTAVPESGTSAFQPRHAGQAKLNVRTTLFGSADGSHATTKRLSHRLQVNAFRTLVPATACI